MHTDSAKVEGGRKFFGGSSGRWAGEQLLRALKEGRPISPAALRTADTLRKDEWKAFDEALIEEGLIRLTAIADLVSMGLTIPVANAMGKTMLEYEKIGDMNEAVVSLSGVDRSEDDRLEFTLAATPLPVTHKDFDLNLRTLAASRERGEALDTTQARVAGRKVAEKLEEMFFIGGKTFGGNTIYGVTTHPNRNTVGFGTNGAWSAAAKTGENILADVQSLVTAAHADRMYGPYMLYVSANSHVKLDSDFKANSDKSIRERLLMVENLRGIKTADTLPADNVVLVQMTRDVVALVDGEGIQTVQWDVEGGFIIKFKAFCIQVPLVRADVQNRSGIVHMS